MHLAGELLYRRRPPSPCAASSQGEPSRRGKAARAAAAHLSRTPSRVPVRPQWRAQHRPGLHQGAGARPGRWSTWRTSTCGQPTSPGSTPTRCSASPDLRMIVVVPAYPDQDGRVSLPPNLVGPGQGDVAADGRWRAGASRRTAWRTRRTPRSTSTPRSASLTTCGPAWARTTPTAVRGPTTASSAQRCSTRTANGLVRCDSTSPASTWVRRTSTISRLLVPCSRHSGTPPDGSTSGVAGPPATARQGSCRTYSTPELGRLTRAWSTPLYRLMYDPDGRSPRQRIKRRY